MSVQFVLLFVHTIMMHACATHNVHVLCACVCHTLCVCVCVCMYVCMCVPHAVCMCFDLHVQSAQKVPLPNMSRMDVHQQLSKDFFSRVSLLVWLRTSSIWGMTSLYSNVPVGDCTFTVMQVQTVMGFVRISIAIAHGGRKGGAMVVDVVQNH